ncbi:LTA synthase family protein [Pasteurellaceae bacterium 22721_9_1]
MAYILLGAFFLTALIFIYNSHYKWTYLFASALFLFFVGIMLGITGQWQRSINFASVLFVVLMLFHRLKIHYYKQPLLISDFFLVFDWRNWETLLHYRTAILAVFALLAILAYGIFGWSNEVSLGYGWQIAGAILTVLSFAIMFHYSKNPDATAVWLDSLPDDGRDVFLNLPMSCRGVFFKTPAYEGNGEAFKQQMQQVEHYPLLSDEQTKPDIVVWLQESTLNPHSLAIAKHQIPPITMYEKQEDTLFLSPLRVHTLGGATWKSEFAFLSGVPSTDFGAMASAVFYSVVPHLKTSFIQNLKQNGYFCVALSPFTKGNYNAKAAYDHLGFDLMLQPQDLGYPAPIGKNLWHIGSDEMSHYAKMILEKKHNALEQVNQPIFLYVLTMKEHGPYRSDCDDYFQLAENGFSAKGLSELNDYIQRIVNLNEVIEEFNQYLKQRENAYVLGYFGDHQIQISGAEPGYVWNYVNPNYVTQFALRSNLKHQFTQQQDFLDLAQVSGVILEAAGLAADAFMQANIAMRKLSGGKLQDCEDAQLLANYRHYLYAKLKITQ